MIHTTRRPIGATPREVLEDALACVVERIEDAGIEHDWQHSFVGEVFSPVRDDACLDP